MTLFDPYGTLAAAMTGIEIQEKMSRGSGRTQTMVSAACDTGGTIICTRNTYDDIVRGIPHTLLYRKKIKVIELDPRNPEYIYKVIRHGPVYFDHYFILKVYEHQIEMTSRIFYDVVHRLPSPEYKHDNGWATRFMQSLGTPP